MNIVGVIDILASIYSIVGFSIGSTKGFVTTIGIIPFIGPD